jgi:aspartyl aminopeptidase
VEAIKAAKPGSHANVCCVFDNEEVGSTTKQGADSTFLADVLRRVALASGRSEEDYYTLLAHSFMLSADNAHAVHPNHPEYSDPLNQTEMNKGIVIKFNANQKYTTDGVSEAVFHQICEKAGVPVQHYANRSDLAGGGTLGNISGRHVSVNTLDIGLAQLAMHSSYETAGTKDVAYMIDGMRAFYETEIRSLGNGAYTLE